MQQVRAAKAASLIAAAIGISAAVTTFRNSGNFLIVDNRQKSDAIVITQGDSLDAAYWEGLHLLTAGYGRELLLDARSNRVFFGRSQAEWAKDFIDKTATGVPGEARVCPIAADTTAEEIYEVGNCLKGRSIRSVILIVDDFHSRRSLTMFSRLLPEYSWSISAVKDATRFGGQWWRKREWIRTAMIEWQHLLWWEIVDRWRYAPVSGAQASG